ncbi:MAG: hypothetical protein WDN49_21025 [Acetobacteraceae bacterium]
MAERDPAHEAAARLFRAELEQRMEQGGLIEAALRGLLYVLRAGRALDERSFGAFEAVREAGPGKRRVSRAQLKDMLRDQSLILRLDEARAVAAIPKLLPADPRPGLRPSPSSARSSRRRANCPRKRQGGSPKSRRCRRGRGIGYFGGSRPGALDGGGLPAVRPGAGGRVPCRRSRACRVRRGPQAPARTAEPGGVAHHRRSLGAAPGSGGATALAPLAIPHRPADDG